MRMSLSVTLRRQCKRVSGQRLHVSHVGGEGYYGHFEHMPAASGRLQAEDFDCARRNANVKREIFYWGVKSELVKEDCRG